MEPLYCSAGSRAFNLRLRSFLVLVVLLGWQGQTFADQSYSSFAESLVQSAPAEAEVAVDIEKAIGLSLNAYRRSKGKRPLAEADAFLVKAARVHAMDLMAMGKVGHIASTGHDFNARIRALKGGGLLMLPAMAENAARDRRKGISRAAKAKALMQQWIDSAAHRKSLTSPDYVAVAIGAVVSGDTVYAVQIFTGPEVKTNLFQSN